ncbi:short-chain dehydrogenase/reductase SDR (plasmid) [Novosphingobium aromaticivorans DSM 12444]|uniref:Short-chain dehydrogenase/reductase SDR n=1 Tax=Novosphingobium aromaticivorans (strain ATCC 700278 / DSM 12444 / CCUG 56034 / CIP 105152 / NBRC 16084 / F199) TaxID=279238 RepID=A4XF65_NOVAD|nr:SDR family oxidoreductase [Novosphingobium aromaticivorans]ABP64576.1 short-chain dehydrogenase/reductase SDR [Novosphingobium aromaticivorans DSM 12444]SCY95225.1 NAD(P)-dependent dehydrogenase, short-chain alcohol dehydrogenase family [Novosphingobium aromaticivorans]
MQLAGKAAIVTGGARGVAKGVAAAFVKAGAKVLIVDREAELGEATAAELSAFGEVAFMQVDLMDREALPGVVEEAVRRFGRLDTLVNAAQASQQLLLKDTTTEAMNLAFGTGFWATFLLMQAAYPHLVASHGSVINFGSGAGIEGMPTQASYGAAKEAIRSLSKVAATEWGPEGVRVNVICPFANSPGVELWRQHFPDAYAGQIAKVPLRRIGDCETDIGAAAVFLASEAAGYITGQTLMVDGGQVKSF